MIQIAMLVIGIIGFIRDRVNVSKEKELRGKPLYIVCSIFVAPLPLALTIGILYGIVNAGQATVDRSMIVMADVLLTFIPLIAGIVLSFLWATPKTEASQARGFPVQPPPPPSNPQ